MRVPLSWLRDFNDCNLSVEEIASTLTRAGLEVEAIDRIGYLSDSVLVGEVVAAADIPDRNLRHVTLDLGADRKVDAVSAAPNLTEDCVGRRVAVALPGAIVVDAKSEVFALTEIQARSFLGIDSAAVVLSDRELGLSDDHRGLRFLADDAAPGSPVRDHVEPTDTVTADVVLEICILPNYGRCLSIVGMARELAALTRTKFRMQLDAAPVKVARNESPEKSAIDIRIECPEIAPRYSGLIYRGAELRPSPAWMQRRLALAGLKPRNNLVDVTNYVMLELGQPMHAFDLESLPAPEITVRRARPDESMHTLDQSLEPDADGQVDAPRALDETIPLITSGDVPVAIAGVIGGLDSEVRETTTDLLLESANFDFIAIRQAMSKLKVITDAGTRFSRQADPAMTVVAIQRAVALLAETAGGQPEGKVIDCYPAPLESREIDVEVRHIERTLGCSLTDDEVSAALERLGFGVESLEKGRLRLSIPGFRPDIEHTADVAEEVIRVIGFDRLEDRALEEPLPKQRPNRSWTLRSRIRSALTGCQLHDVLNYSLTTVESEARLLRGRPATDAEGDPAPYVHLINPASQDRCSLRRTVLGSLLENVEKNHRTRQRIALFEIGTVFHPEKGQNPEKSGAGGSRPGETSRLGIALSGPRAEASWSSTETELYDFFDLKGIVEALFGRLHIREFRFAPACDTPYHPGVAAVLLVGETPVGALGQIHPRVAEAYNLGKRRVFAAEFDLEPLVAASTDAYPYTPFSRFPTVRQDLALIVDDGVPAQHVQQVIEESAGELLNDIRLFDIYRGDQIGADKKSLAFELSFSAPDRSLTEDEVNELRESMLGPLGEKIGATIR